jgi:hypothetical protein
MWLKNIIIGNLIIRESAIFKLFHNLVVFLRENTISKDSIYVIMISQRYYHAIWW